MRINAAIAQPVVQSLSVDAEPVSIPSSGPVMNPSTDIDM